MYEEITKGQYTECFDTFHCGNCDESLYVLKDRWEALDCPSCKKKLRFDIDDTEGFQSSRKIMVLN